MNRWLDAQLPPAVAGWMKGHFGIEAAGIESVGLRHANDLTIFRRFSSNGDVIVTKDEDFVDLVLRLGIPPQVLWVTCGNVTNRGLRELFTNALPAALSLLQAGEPVVEIR